MVLCRNGLSTFVSYASPKAVSLKEDVILKAGEHQLFLDIKPKYTQQWFFLKHDFSTFSQRTIKISRTPNPETKFTNAYINQFVFL